MDNLSGKPLCGIPVGQGRWLEIQQRLSSEGEKRVADYRAARGKYDSAAGHVFQGHAFLGTLRNVVDDDKKWFKLIHDFFQHFKYQNIMTEDVVAYFNQHTGMDLTPIFNQYLGHTAIPTLELKFDESGKTVSYRWKVDEPGFAMPVRVGKKDAWQVVQATTEWKTMPTVLSKDEFGVATDCVLCECKQGVAAAVLKSKFHPVTRKRDKGGTPGRFGNESSFARRTAGGGCPYIIRYPF